MENVSSDSEKDSPKSESSIESIVEESPLNKEPSESSEQSKEGFEVLKKSNLPKEIINDIHYIISEIDKMKKKHNYWYILSITMAIVIIFQMYGYRFVLGF